MNDEFYFDDDLLTLTINYSFLKTITNSLTDAKTYLHICSIDSALEYIDDESNETIYIKRQQQDNEITLIAFFLDYQLTYDLCYAHIAEVIKLYHIE